MIVLILFDQIGVYLRYVKSDDFSPARKVEKPFQASAIDKEILKDKSHFRVANLTVSPLEDGTTSYFHQSIGGYHAAKMGRYKELFDYQVARNNIEVLHMLNAKYLIVLDDKGNPQLQLNDKANGNAWFVQNLKQVTSANDEMKSLDSIQSKSEAVIDISKIETKLPNSFAADSTAIIQLVKNNLTELTYLSKSDTDQFAVFSEIFYADGWNAYLNGKLVPHFRVNYVLRGMQVPAGDNQIEFKFEPKVIQQGSFISLASYGLLVLLMILGFLKIRKASTQ